MWLLFEFYLSTDIDNIKNLMLKHEQKGLMNLLQRYGIDPAKERTREQERDER